MPKLWEAFSSPNNNDSKICFKKDSRFSIPLESARLFRKVTNSCGHSQEIPFLCSELVLLYKAWHFQGMEEVKLQIPEEALNIDAYWKNDCFDFHNLWAVMNASQRAWFRDALAQSGRSVPPWRLEEH